VQDNGGTILAISSHGFAIVAGDTRQSEGYSIQTRYARKTFQLTDNVVVAVVGFQADGTALVKRIKQRLEVSWSARLRGAFDSVGPHGALQARLGG